MPLSDRPLTVLQFGMTYAPKWRDGGPPRIMYDYARHLLEQGIHVMVLTGDNNRPKPEDNWPGFPPGLDIHYCRKLGGWRSQYYFDYSWEELTEFFDRYWRQIDFIHLYQTRSIFNVVSLWAERKYGLRIVLSSFGSMPRRASMNKFVYDQFFVLPLARETELLLAQTRNECEVYLKYAGRPDHIHLLPLAVDLAKRPPLEANMPRVFREKYGIAPSVRLFLFVGRLHPTKGVEFLVNCFARVAENEPDVHLAIVGHDEGSRAGVQEAIKVNGLESKVTLCGPLFDTARWPAYAAADCFVIMPEIQEETSLASLEALSCGTPVITSHRADVPWLEEYGAGIVVRGGDQAATVATMLEICRATPSELVEQRKSAVRLIWEKFEIGAVTRQYALLLAQAARAPVRRNEKGPLLIGPLPRAVETSGQAVCFKLLVDGLTARNLAGPVVNLGSADTQTGKPTFRRALEYVSILARVGWQCLTTADGVYITIAQSRHGFFRDAVMIVLARLTGNDVILHLNGGNYDNFYKSEPRPIQAVIRMTLRRARTIVILAESLRDCFGFDPALQGKLRVVQNSFPAAEVPTDLPARSSQSSGEPTLLYLSNLIESKGYLEVLEVLCQLRQKEGIAARAIFCGTILANPSDDIRVQSADQALHYFHHRAKELGVSDFVAYRGSVGGVEKESVLRESDFLVFPTRYDNEGQPVVLIEALAYGLPAIATDYRANSEMVVEGVTGHLLDWRDTAGMARKIASLWRNPAAYTEMSARCRAHFEEHFTPKAHIDAMKEILFHKTA